MLSKHSFNIFIDTPSIHTHIFIKIHVATRWVWSWTLVSLSDALAEKKSKYKKGQNTGICDLDLRNLASSCLCCKKQYNLKVWWRNIKVIGNIEFSWQTDRQRDGQFHKCQSWSFINCTWSILIQWIRIVLSADNLT